MMESIFFELGLILIVATLLALFFKKINQPPLLAFMVTGLVMGPLVLNVISSAGEIQAFAQIGVALLLFIVGLRLNPNILREVGKISFYTGIGQIVFTFIIGFFLIRYLGFTALQSVYISIALVFSSTILVVKLLSDKRELDTLYGKISLGVLIVQDAVAVLLLIILSSLKTSELTSSINLAIVNGAILVITTYVAARFFLTKFFEKVARSQETLFLTAISWCFALSIIAYMLGFTIEIGAFLAGITLASLPYSIEISKKIRPLRDFFIVLFFVSIGSSIVLTNFKQQLYPILALSAFVLIGNPLIVMVVMGIFGFKARTQFLVGLALAQISEFSLIVVAMGYKLGHLSAEIVSLVSAVGVITIAISTYMITKNEQLFRLMQPYLGFFEKKKLYEKRLAHHQKSRKYEIILMGQHRIGYSILKNLIKRKARLLVVDFNPTIIKNLMEKNIPCMYGDIADPDILRELRSYKPKIIISTIHLFEDNVVITKIFREINRNVTIIATASTIKEALDLYSEGADYVIIPHILGGERVSDMLKTTISSKKRLKKLRNDHIKALINAEIPQQ